MVELREGKMSGKELATWFGITYGTYKNKRIKKLQELKDFCDFEEFFGGVIIKEVHLPTYVKGLSKKEDKLYTELVLQTENNLSSVAGMARKLIATKEEYANISFNTLYRRLIKAGIRGYGKIKEGESGSYGRRKMIWAIKVSDFNEYRFMTEEEKEYYGELISKAEQKTHSLERGAWLSEAEENGEITEKDVIENLKRLKKIFYNEVIEPFRMKFNAQIARTTEHEVYKSQIRRLLEEEGLLAEYGEALEQMPECQI